MSEEENQQKVNNLNQTANEPQWPAGSQDNDIFRDGDFEEITKGA